MQKRMKLFKAIERVGRALPTQVINHTDEFVIRNWPIAVSIETKRQGEGRLAAAELQLGTGTWDTEWSPLERLIAQSGAIVVHGIFGLLQLQQGRTKLHRTYTAMVGARVWIE
ncbi:hypothetical protein N7455_007792 [Penicillium solitum]|uniref:uncharacterized protein n=1 Tax=Penicillium solitum TaxID=60172 RepID=UPI0032C3F26A|nr:hypothetical protein N7455_007792 [Penicillium solitum]